MALPRDMSNDRRAELNARLDRHRAEPHVTLEQYERRRRIEVGQSLMGKRRLYLDQCFWIYIRDVVIGRRTDAASVELLARLRRLA